MIKHCNLCNTDKSINDFYKGLTYCRVCHKKNREAYYIKNKQKKIEYAIQYRKKVVQEYLTCFPSSTPTGLDLGYRLTLSG